LQHRGLEAGQQQHLDQELLVLLASEPQAPTLLLREQEPH
jgi:hypothetical protein